MDESKYVFIGNFIGSIIGLILFAIITIGMIILKAFTLIDLSWTLVLLPIGCYVGVSILAIIIILVMLIIDLFNNDEDDMLFK